MIKISKNTEVIDINGKKIKRSDAIPIALVRPSILKLIKKKYSTNSNSYISKTELQKYKRDYFENIIKTESGEISHLEKEVLNSLMQQESIVKNINKEIDKNLKFKEKVSDLLASYAGSWSFLIVFLAVVIGWIILNAIFLYTKPLDPYPFILLNLLLSCVAALQAPIILMSQNRKEAIDRKRAENDYKINLKAELEVRLLHEKMDHLLETIGKKLFEVQELQLESIEDGKIKK